VPLLTKSEAAALVRRTFGKFKGTAVIPVFADSDVLDVVETPLRDSTLVDVYVGKLWEGPARTTGPGLSMFKFTRVGRKWVRGSGSFHVVKGKSKADLMKGLAAFRALRARSLPKPVLAAAPRRKSSAPAITEAKGAGKLASLQIVGKKPKPIAAKDFDAAEKKLGTRFPAGYRTVIGALGQGVIGELVRISPPAKIALQRKTWRAAIETHWFWGASPIAQAHALEGYRLGDTENGDQLIVLPEDPDAIILLPRSSEQSRLLGRGLATALAAYVKTKRTFQPF
jgi:hypothetical protein